MLAVAAVLVLASCVHKKPAPGSAVVVVCPPLGCPGDDRKALEGGTIRVHADAEPAGLCDLVNHEAWVRSITENQVMETLFQQSPDGTLHPRLARSWRREGHELVLSLQKDVRFSDGVPFDAGDVVFTLERARDATLGADQRSDLAPITKIASPDPYTVVLTVPGPAPFLLQALAHIAMYPRHLLDKADLRTTSFCRAPIGTGPYRVASWRSGVDVELRRVEGYWGERPHLDGIEYVFVRDRQAAYLLYERGQLDVLNRLPREHGALPGHRIYRYTPRAFFFALWNTRRPELQSPQTRAQLGHLFDLPRFITSAFDGHARLHSGPYLEGTPSYDEHVAPWPYDPVAARALGGKLHKLTFLSTVGSPAVEQLATLLEEDLRRVGIELVIERLDFARLLERLRRHDFDVTALQLTLAPEQDNFGLLHSSAGDEQNWAGYADADTDALLERIRATDDPDARHALDRELHRLLHQRGPMTFLVSPETETAVAPGFGGVRPSADGLDLTHAFRVAP
ncbi:MAG: ABC transporter substrate-binding protein [Polyangia bacterium]